MDAQTLKQRYDDLEGQIKYVQDVGGYVFRLTSIDFSTCFVQVQKIHGKVWIPFSNVAKLRDF